MTKTLEKYMDFIFFIFLFFFQKTARFLCNAYLENNDE